MIKRFMLAVMMVMTIGGALTVAVTPSTVTAECNSSFLGLPAWYDGLTEGDDCDIKNPSEVGGIGNFIWLIALNVIQAVIVLLGYGAAIIMTYGGFLFIMSRGKPDEAAKARTTMQDAFIGLILAIGAAAIVSFVSNGLFGG